MQLPRRLIRYPLDPQPAFNCDVSKAAATADWDNCEFEDCDTVLGDDYNFDAPNIIASEFERCGDVAVGVPNGEDYEFEDCGKDFLSDNDAFGGFSY